MAGTYHNTPFVSRIVNGHDDFGERMLNLLTGFSAVLAFHLKCFRASLFGHILWNEHIVSKDIFTKLLP